MRRRPRGRPPGHVAPCPAERRAMMPRPPDTVHPWRHRSGDSVRRDRRNRVWRIQPADAGRAAESMIRERAGRGSRRPAAAWRCSPERLMQSPQHGHRSWLPVAGSRRVEVREANFSIRGASQSQVQQAVLLPEECGLLLQIDGYPVEKDAGLANVRLVGAGPYTAEAG